MKCGREGHPSAPHRRAPEVLASHPNARKRHLQHTFRAGTPTVDALAPLYDFTFFSLRPDRHLDGRDEITPAVVSESGQVTINALTLSLP